MIDTVNTALEGRKWRFQKFDEDQRCIFKMGIGLENGKADLVIDVREKEKRVIIYVSGPVNTPEPKRQLLADFLTRANYGLIIGNFEMDFNDGEIRYKSSYVFDDTFPPSEDVFLKSMYAAINTFDRYLPGIMVLMFGNITPQDAIAQVENAPNPISN